MERMMVLPYLGPQALRMLFRLAAGYRSAGSRYPCLRRTSAPTEVHVIMLGEIEEARCFWLSSPGQRKRNLQSITSHD